MLCTVVPVHNEAAKIDRVMDTLISLPGCIIIPVINGCTDASAEIIGAYPRDRVHSLRFRDPLGIDIPRAVGGAYARRLGAEIVLFVDGDMDGSIRGGLLGLIKALMQNRADVALTDCYAGAYRPLSLQAQYMGLIRALFNRSIGFDALGTATPSHGPHAVSRRFLETIPVSDLAVPPVTMAVSSLAGLKAVIGAGIPHSALGSPDRGAAHTKLLWDTLTGDYLEAFAVYQGKERSRALHGITYQGYHPARRFDLLAAFLRSL